MDGRQFDDLVIALGRTTTRRQWIKTCIAGLIAVALGRDAYHAVAQDDPDEPEAAPLPNFPFLAVMPTDSRFSAFAVNEEITGPPTRYRSLEAMRALTDEWRAALGPGFQSAYAATVARPRADDPDMPERSITTCIFDLGSPEAVAQARPLYLQSLFNLPELTELEVGVENDSQIVLGGCNGGCERLSAPMASSTPASRELVIIGGHGQFMFDARLRIFNDDDLDLEQGDSITRLVDNRLSAVTRLTSSASTGTTARRGVLGALGRTLGLGKRGLRAQATPAELRDALASRNSLPIFDLGSGDPPLKAKQTLVVDRGDIVVNFGESAERAAARQRSVEDVVFACATDQPLPLDPAYHGGYDLNMTTVQYVFATEEDAEEFLEETRDRLDRDRPRIVLTEVLTDEDEIRDVYQDGREDRGYSYGCMTHQVLRLGPVTAILAVEVKATPRSADEEELSPEDLEDELCPVVEQAAEKFSLCIFSPDECRSAFALEMPGARQVTPASDCDEPLVDCNGQCVDTSQDETNCGGCGRACAPNRFCVDGLCLCAQGLTDCGDYCAEISSDGDNCGGCGLSCGPDQVCSQGTCVCPNGEQVACGDTCCSGAQTCVNGACVEPCGPPLTDCGGICVDTMSDEANCGGCGQTCGGDCCFGQCTDTWSDPTNCGGCGNNCGNGVCCGGVCADLMNDPNNCSGCGEVCSSGTCCGGFCADTNTDSSNCGSCGNICASTEYCDDGECISNIG